MIRNSIQSNRLRQNIGVLPSRYRSSKPWTAMQGRIRPIRLCHPEQTLKRPPVRRAIHSQGAVAYAYQLWFTAVEKACGSKPLSRCRTYTGWRLDLRSAAIRSSCDRADDSLNQRYRLTHPDSTTGVTSSP